MPEPISSNSSSVGACDPTNTCCEETEGVPAQPSPPATRSAPSEPPVVTIPPIYITGDAAQQLTKHYDERAAAACTNERNAVVAACPNIAAAVVDSGPSTAYVASLVCAQLITAYDSCKDTIERRLKAADFCETQGKAATLGARPDEIICWKLPE